VRRAQGEDLVKVIELVRHTPDAPRWEDGVWREIAGQGDARPGSRVVLLAEAGAGGELVGVAVAGCRAGIGEVEMLVVAQRQRRLGIGRLLCAEVMRWAEAQGASEMQLEVRASNIGAQELYRKLGFAEVGRRTRYYRDPAEDAVLMDAALCGEPWTQNL
jgi:ribosomal-protein-alanine acetyltransferase